MKIRTSFVSNSSSSSFIVGSNCSSFEQTIEDNWEEIFPAHGAARMLIRELRRYAVYELEDHNTWPDWNSFLVHVKNNWWSEGLTEECEAIWKPFFDNWKFVHEVTIKDGGDGGGRIEGALRTAMPKEFKDKNIEIKFWN